MIDCKRYFPDIQAQGDCRNCGCRFEDHEKTGLFNMLSDAQKELALNFCEDESFGPEELKMRNPMKLTTTEISVHSEKENPIFGETVTKVCLFDEGGGIFLKLIQHTDSGVQEIRLDFIDIPAIVQAINILKNGVDENG